MLVEEGEEYENDQQDLSTWQMSSPASKRASMYQLRSNANNSNQSLNVPKRNHHRRKSSMAAEAYTPQILTPTPPQPNAFKFGSLSNNSQESLNTSTNKASYRRGHRYKHSSVSMNLFQEAPKAIVKNVPQKYSIPSMQEIKDSVNQEQWYKVSVCLLQLTFLLITYGLGLKTEYDCLTTLSHVLFYDFIANCMVVVVSIMANFSIWKMSSLVYPFGLGRIEVLCSFGLSVSLLFVGLDLISHIIEEGVMEVISIDESGGLENHVHAHNSQQLTGSALHIPLPVYELVILLVICVSIFTSHSVNSSEDDADLIKQEPKVISRLSSITLNAPYRQSLTTRVLKLVGLSADEGTQQQGGQRNIMSSSTTLLTVSYAIYCMVYPLVASSLINEASTVVISMMILWIGNVLIKRYAYTLLIGTPCGADMSQELQGLISELDCYRSTYSTNSIDVARVNHSVWVCVVELSMPGADDDEEAKVRFYVHRVVQGVLTRAVNDYLPVSRNGGSRGTLLDLMSTTPSSKAQFEITVCVDRSVY